MLVLSSLIQRRQIPIWIQRGNVGIHNTYDPLGQRIRKTSGTAVTYFVYDEQGQLLGEYDQNRNMIREYLWMGDRLVGMMSAQIPNVVLRVHTDHLGTPRAVSEGQRSTTPPERKT